MSIICFLVFDSIQLSNLKVKYLYSSSAIVKTTCYKPFSGAKYFRKKIIDLKWCCSYIPANFSKQDIINIARNCWFVWFSCNIKISRWWRSQAKRSIFLLSCFKSYAKIFEFPLQFFVVRLWYSWIKPLLWSKFRHFLYAFCSLSIQYLYFCFILEL